MPRSRSWIRPARGLTAAVLLVGIGGCGGSSDVVDGKPATTSTVPSATTASAPASAAAAAKGPKLGVVHSDYGSILADGRGRALYLFTADHGKASNCSEDCATAWPPYVVKRAPIATARAKPGKIGTTRRDDGRLQATYAGHPVYYYEGDNEPGEVLCQAVNEFGGYWYVLRSSGKAVH